MPIWSYRSRMSPEKLAMAKHMRRNPTPAEKAMWQLIRCQRVRGLKFVRQQRALGYIVDFYCASRRLVVEVDGSVHDVTVAYDAHRDMALREHGFKVLRVTNDDVFRKSLEVVQRVAAFA